MNQTIIQERSGLNQFYAKVYAFVGLGIGLSALVSALMLTVSKKIFEVRMLRRSRNWLQKKRYPFLGPQKNPSLK